MNEILNLFRNLISERLFLVWKDGEAILSYEFDKHQKYDDSYDFQPTDYIEITPSDVAREFRVAAQEKCDEWSCNRRICPDCEFLLFGHEKLAGGYSAFKVTVDRSGWYPGASVRIQTDPICYGALTAIGSLQVSCAAFGDEGLLDGLKGWRENQSKTEIADMLADPKWKDTFPGTNLPTSARFPAPNLSASQVERRFMEILRHTGDVSVGGSFTVASGVSNGAISLTPKK